MDKIWWNISIEIPVCKHTQLECDSRWDVPPLQLGADQISQQISLENFSDKILPWPAVLSHWTRLIEVCTMEVGLWWQSGQKSQGGWTRIDTLPQARCRVFDQPDCMGVSTICLRPKLSTVDENFEGFWSTWIKHTSWNYRRNILPSSVGLERSSFDNKTVYFYCLQVILIS